MNKIIKYFKKENKYTNLYIFLVEMQIYIYSMLVIGLFGMLLGLVLGISIILDK